MASSLFGAATTIGRLRSGMTDLMQRFRGSTSRLANATEASSTQGAPFLEALGDVRPASTVDVERETTLIADTAMRFDAASSLLTTEYASLRAAMRRDG